MAFECPDPDFYIRCLPDGELFGVRRDKMVQGSQVFDDMFACCNDGEKVGANDMTEIVDIHEHPSHFAVFLRLLHSPPSPYTEPPPISERYSTTHKLLVSLPFSPVLPLPLLGPLLHLAEKFLLSPAILHILHTHLWAHRSTHPLTVYALAASFPHSDACHWISDEASMFLVHPPLHTYPLAEVAQIPSAEAYHKLLVLQNHRTRALSALLEKEQLFPHGYGRCSKHAAEVLHGWAERKARLRGRVDSGTDVAAEMAATLEELQGCETCFKAWTAATEMLAYKCRRVPRRLDKLFPSSQSRKQGLEP